MSNFIVDIDAGAYGRVQKFQAKNDVRYYQQGVHVAPCTDGPCLEGTNGHCLYVEQDAEGEASKDCILSLTAPARLLREGNRVKLSDDGVLGVFDSAGIRLYVEPNGGVVDGKFPDITAVIGNPGEWLPGLIGAANADYLRAALDQPGAISFWRPREDADHTSVILFTVERAGIKAFGAIMPMRGLFNKDARAEEFLPSRYLPKPESVAEPVREAA